MKQLQGRRVGQYVLDEFVGAGKIGYVYKAHREDISEIINAVKLVPLTRPGWDTELKKVAKLANIPNVVHFHSLEACHLQHDSETVLVQATIWNYIHPGRNLKDYLLTVPNCSVSFLYAVVTTVLRVLHACEKLGIARHGDLHPGNILIGEQDDAQLDTTTLNPIEPIYVSDFGFGATGGKKMPKDDYAGLALIVDAIIQRIDWESAPASDRVLLTGCRDLLKKVARENTASERYSPFDLLKTLQQISLSSARITSAPMQGDRGGPLVSRSDPSVGQFQISEMLGDDWELWKSLFVPRVPAGTRILERDLTSVVTGPRGCGKTMLFRRLSERLILECGPVDDIPQSFVGLYVNANDISDAFSTFPERPDQNYSTRLVCYLHLCILTDALSVQAIAIKNAQQQNGALAELLEKWFGAKPLGSSLVTNEDPLTRYRTHLEQIKRKFVYGTNEELFPAQKAFGSHSFLRDLIPQLRESCSWLSDRMAFVFLDDYTTPRVSDSMQRVLNRVVFQRSSDFVFKVATEAATTFVPEDSSGKVLQDGDDYKLVDMGEESLFMSEQERESFLNDVFTRRLARDPRLREELRHLPVLLGNMGMTKTEFARLLRSDSNEAAPPNQAPTQLRGAARKKALYCGHDTFTALWSGDTRLMIQLMQEVVDAEVSQTRLPVIGARISSETQDRVFRNRGGQWLEQQRRNLPTDQKSFDRLVTEYQTIYSDFSLSGSNFGGHLKAIVEAFKTAARAELMGPTYTMIEKGSKREVPKMAFRVEITDEFRLSDIATAVYRDLIRYGIFMRDARGKSIRGAMVPRLYLRRLLLPYCVLPLSKRDSVSMSCQQFTRLLLYPDRFANEWQLQRASRLSAASGQLPIRFEDDVLNRISEPEHDARYDDTSNESEQ
jgi:hypothetical protein